MCISILSTAHPDYPFILLSNRDEFLNRPTSPAAWWQSPDQHVLGGRDLQRQPHGTWLGCTKQGRIAILTNFREEGVDVARDKSRGGITYSYLTTPPNENQSAEDFVADLINKTGIHDVGGFTLLFGQLRASRDNDSAGDREGVELPGLAVISNRTDSTKSLTRIATHTGETLGLSNSHYGDTSWPKVVRGEELLRQAIKDNVEQHQSEAQLIKAGFEILSTDTLPSKKADEDSMTYVRQFRNSIFIPSVGEDKLTAYGTQKQTIILFNKDGRVVFVERTLYDENANPLPDDRRDQRVEFEVEGWRD